jgi:hypothetical protein
MVAFLNTWLLAFIIYWQSEFAQLNFMFGKIVTFCCNLFLLYIEVEELNFNMTYHRTVND